MRRLLLISATTTMILAGAGVASAQHAHDGGAVAFTPEHGNMLRQHSTSQHYNSVSDPNFHAQVGAILPGAVQIHPLPDTLAPRVPQGHQYGYGLVNDRPVIVDHSSRRIIHSFD